MIGRITNGYRSRAVVQNRRSGGGRSIPVMSVRADSTIMAEWRSISCSPIGAASSWLRGSWGTRGWERSRSREFFSIRSEFNHRSVIRNEFDDQKYTKTWYVKLTCVDGGGTTGGRSGPFGSDPSEKIVGRSEIRAPRFTRGASRSIAGNYDDKHDESHLSAGYLARWRAGSGRPRYSHDTWSGPQLFHHPMQIIGQLLVGIIRPV